MLYKYGGDMFGMCGTWGQQAVLAFDNKLCIYCFPKTLFVKERE